MARVTSTAVPPAGYEDEERLDHDSDHDSEGRPMSIKGKAYIAGIHEHPTRKADDKTLAQLHAESAHGALADAGLTMKDVDGYFCAGDAPGLGGLSMADYMGLKLRHVDRTEPGSTASVS